MSWFWRGVQFVGGAAEAAGGVILAAGGSVVTAGVGSPVAIAGGAAIGAHGIDQMVAAWYGTESYASQAGRAAFGYAFGEEYAYIGGFLGDLGPFGGAVGLLKGVKSLPQLLQKLRSVPGKVDEVIGGLREAGKLSDMLKGLPDEEIADMLKRGEITLDDIEKAGLDPRKFDIGAKASKSPHVGAALGEAKAHDLMKQKGFERIDNAGDYKPGSNGIDGVYKNPTPPPDFVIMEAKYNTARVGKLTDGTRQMSDKWVSDRLVKAVGEGQAATIEKAMIEGKIEKWVVKTDIAGNTTAKVLDGNGYVIRGTKGKR